MVNVITLNKIKREKDFNKIRIGFNQCIERKRKITRKEFIGMMMIHCNLSKKTCSEYVDAMAQACDVEFKDGQVIPKENSMLGNNAAPLEDNTETISL